MPVDHCFYIHSADYSGHLDGLYHHAGLDPKNLLLRNMARQNISFIFVCIVIKIVMVSHGQTFFIRMGKFHRM